MRDIHVLPIGDLYPHEETRDSWCGPQLMREPEAAIAEVLVVHNSADGRELVEEHGVN